jgi:hypothetical protein
MHPPLYYAVSMQPHQMKMDDLCIPLLPFETGFPSLSGVVIVSADDIVFSTQCTGATPFVVTGDATVLAISKKGFSCWSVIVSLRMSSNEFGMD